MTVSSFAAASAAVRASFFVTAPSRYILPMTALRRSRVFSCRHSFCRGLFLQAFLSRLFQRIIDGLLLVSGQFIQRTAVFLHQAVVQGTGIFQHVPEVPYAFVYLLFRTRTVDVLCRALSCWMFRSSSVDCSPWLTVQTSSFL